MSYFIIYAWSDCPFCISAKELLEEKGAHHMMVNLDHDDVLLTYLKKYYKWNTVPLILLREMPKGDTTLIGGYTDLIKHLEG